MNRTGEQARRPRPGESAGGLAESRTRSESALRHMNSRLPSVTTTRPADPRRLRDPGRPAAGDGAVIVSLHPAVDSARPVIELEFGILVYPPETDGEPWRATFTENGQRKYRQGATEAKLAAKLEKVNERLRRRGEHGAARRGPDRALPGPRPAARRGAVVPQARRTPSGGCASGSPPRSSARSPARTSRPGTPSRSSTPRPPPGKARGSSRMLSALVAAGIEGGYLANPRLAKVHWQAGDRPLPAPAGERGRGIGAVGRSR